MDSDFDNDEYENWFYSSVKRYNTLQMFELRGCPEHIIQTGDDSVCVACTYQNGKTFELLNLKIPKKLTIGTPDEGRCKDNDFKMMSELPTPGRVVQLNLAKRYKYVLTSQEGRHGLFGYNVEQHQKRDTTDTSCKVGEIQLESPVFAIDNDNMELAACNSTRDKIWHVSLETGQCIQNITSPFADLDSQMTCEYNSEMLCLLDVKSGAVVMRDLRSENNVTLIKEDRSTCADQLWSLASYQTCPLGYVGVVSCSGSCSILDTRNLQCLVKEKLFDGNSPQGRPINMKFTSAARFSISGCSPSMFVYSYVGDRLEKLFTHDGHQLSSFGVKGNTVTDHIWLNNITDNLLLSCCDNQTMNCWEYVCQT